MSGSAPGDRGNDADPRLRADGRREVVDPLAVDVDMDEPSHLAAFVEHEIAHGERTQGLAERLRVDFEPLLPARLGREQSGEEDDGHRLLKRAGFDREDGRQVSGRLDDLVVTEHIDVTALRSGIDRLVVEAHPLAEDG